MALNITELEIQKLIETLKSFFPENNIVFTDDVKQQFDKLTLSTIEKLKNIVSLSNENNARSVTLMQNIQLTNTKLDDMKNLCDDLENTISNQFPSDVSSRYFEKTSPTSTPQ